MKMMASASAPLARRASAAARTAAASTAVRMVPSANVRSATSRRRSRSAIGRNSPHRPQVLRRSRRRISKTSRKPRVVMTPMRGPRRSNSVLVPTVVPWTIEPKSAILPSASSPCMKPAASLPRSDGTLAVRKLRAAASNRNRSVKVPPTSTPTSGLAALMPAPRCASVRWRFHRPGHLRLAPRHSRAARPRARHSPAVHRARLATARASTDRRSRRRPASPAARAGLCGCARR